MALTLSEIREILLKENLLKEFVSADGWHLTIRSERTFQAISYDSRKVSADTLFVCKGLNFKAEYLEKAVADGLEVYVAEKPYEEINAKLGIIVTDVRKALAILSMAFYDYPQEKLTIIGITGTKGKTTTAYFAKTVMEQATNHHTAFFSSEETTVDGKNYTESLLTTPESLEIYSMMAEAVGNGMTHLVMEVSSQAYKIDRVYGLTFDVGIFLNIGLDHVGPIEHPTFEDYFYCKRLLVKNSKIAVVNRDEDYFDVIKETAELYGRKLVTFGLADADYTYQTDTVDHLRFNVASSKNSLDLAGSYVLEIPGDFNQSNALAAAAACRLAGADIEAIKNGLAHTTVPGRMNILSHPNGAQVYVDYAHNYISFKALFDFAKSVRPDGQIIVVTGSSGGKAQSRRPDIGRAIGEYADIAVLTADDPNYEDPRDVTRAIAAAINNEQVHVIEEIDREQAIITGLRFAKPKDTVIIAGKGTEHYMKWYGESRKWEGDYYVAKRVLADWENYK